MDKDIKRYTNGYIEENVEKKTYKKDIYIE